MIKNKSKKFIVIVSIFSLIILTNKVTDKYNQDSSIETNSETNYNEKKYVYPLGKVVGVKANTDGVLVVGYEDDDIEYIGGIQKGDNIVEIDGNKIENSEDVSLVLDKVTSNEVDVKFERNNQYIEDKVKVKYENGQAKLGLWVRDKISGVGTVTFYDPQNNKFKAIGHAITDVDTNEFLNIKEGNIYNPTEFNVIKSSGGKVGKIDAKFTTEEDIGTFSNNSNFGISGEITGQMIEQTQLIEVGKRDDVKVGDASILFEDENRNILSYDIKISDFVDESDNDRDMVIEVIDDDLIDYTGGIVQGMSGAPIIQDNKIVGVITHVFKENSKKGYGIFIDEMIELDKRY